MALIGGTYAETAVEKTGGIGLQAVAGKPFVRRGVRLSRLVQQAIFQPGQTAVSLL
jgi:hypothetical protein